MKREWPLLITLLSALGAQAETKLTYPPAPKSEQVDDYHGTKISDPYRELENADAPDTQKWVESENALTFGYLAKLPQHDAIKKNLTGLANFDRTVGMRKAAQHYLYWHNTGLQNQNVLYVKDSLDGPSRVLLDPNTYRADGTTALIGTSVSWNGKWLAYAVAQAGSDWGDWHVREIATGKDLSDLVLWTKSGSVAWAKDDQGFYYSRYPEPSKEKVLTAQALNQKIYYHKIGDPQSSDQLVYERPDHPEWSIGPEVTEDGRYLIIG